MDLKRVRYATVIARSEATKQSEIEGRRRCSGLLRVRGNDRCIWRPSPQLRHDVHEALHPLRLDRIPGLAVDLEMGADHHAVGDGEDFADIVDGDAGVGEDRDAPERPRERCVRFDRSTGSPVSGPETRIASASEEKTALLARSAIGRSSSEWANSALMLKRSFMSSRPSWRRRRRAPAASGAKAPCRRRRRR